MKNTYVRLQIPYKSTEQIEEILNTNDIYQYSIEYCITNVMDCEDAYREEIQEESFVTIVIAEQLDSNIISQIESIMGTNTLQLEEFEYDENEFKDTHKGYFDTIIVNDMLAIVPEWINERPSQQFAIRMNPGYSFGTGIHATTRDCMRLLSKVIHKGDRVVDAGSGSGILTLASLVLGAQHVVSVEIDPHCLDVIQRNMHINGLDDKNAEIIIGDILKTNINYNDFNVLVLNIGPMVAAEWLKMHGMFIQNSLRIIISGLTQWSKNKVDDAIQLCQRHILESYSEDGEWITYLI